MLSFFSKLRSICERYLKQPYLVGSGPEEGEVESEKAESPIPPTKTPTPQPPEPLVTEPNPETESADNPAAVSEAQTATPVAPTPVVPTACLEPNASPIDDDLDEISDRTETPEPPEGSLAVDSQTADPGAAAVCETSAAVVPVSSFPEGEPISSPESPALLEREVEGTSFLV